jgi:hypothetical protein
MTCAEKCISPMRRKLARALMVIKDCLAHENARHDWPGAIGREVEKMIAWLTGLADPW